ncbi:Phospho-2-dehydro-3-deoxyheptonate aldolase [Lachnellula suecica]|uniref:Phospho-2-dehydro-3-deoxyheptonate aldolase n=1 Tax=Lachnellula suecica TaxID=602035 RepID=A0A8T9BXB1_9HELO|nr:Phospho-2-dehydro-3-deoxyheptonate aldolase [Lachnellula suecica]
MATQPQLMEEFCSIESSNSQSQSVMGDAAKPAKPWHRDLETRPAVNRQLWSNNWHPASWTRKRIEQEAVYDDRSKVEKSLSKLARLPPIVTPTEIVRLKNSLRDVALGNAFLLQGGDCAELFDYCEENAIESKVKLLLQMSLVLIWGSNKPVVRIARMAGQYAKPRSSPTEIVDGKELPSFRGDILNGFELDERTLDPSRLVDAYFHSASTLNFLRASLSSGLADLHSPLDWGLGHVKDRELQAKYSKTVESITDSLSFMRTVGADSTNKALETVDLYTSHEGLLLEYEQSLTRKLKNPSNSIKRSHDPQSTTAPESEDKSWYDTSAHFIWIGDRTRQIDGAHIEFFRGIENPLGVKVGPTTKTWELLAILSTLNPSKEVGKITLITRYGASKVRTLLPEHIRAVENSRFARTVVWQCDPMHGNTRSTSAGIKTRQFSDILSELQQCMAIHKEEGSYLGGVHLELTGDAVTECTGGSEGLKDDDLSLNYTSFCDPRLNEKQALELAFLIAGHLRATK